MNVTHICIFLELSWHSNLQQYSVSFSFKLKNLTTKNGSCKDFTFCRQQTYFFCMNLSNLQTSDNSSARVLVHRDEDQAVILRGGLDGTVNLLCSSQLFLLLQSSWLISIVVVDACDIWPLWVLGRKVPRGHVITRAHPPRNTQIPVDHLSKWDEAM